MKGKGLYIAIFFFLGLGHLKAQLILNEGFEDSFPPAAWTSLTYSYNGWAQGPASLAMSGNYCAMQNNDFSTDNSDAWLIGPGYTLLPGITYRLSYWYRTSSPLYYERFKVTVGTAPTVAGQLTILHDYPSFRNTTYVQGIDNFTVPAAGVYYFGFYCYSSAFTQRLLLDNIVFEQVSGVACNGTPDGGTANGPAAVCAGSGFTLTLTGNFPSGSNFQWQSSPAGQNNFTNISSAITTTCNISQSSSMDYRCVVTCIYSNLQSASNIVNVFTPSACYCVPPASNCAGNNTITNVIASGINNNSGCSTNGYADYTNTVPRGSFAAGTSVPISVTVGSGGTQQVVAWIDYNKNGFFDANEYNYLGTGNGSVVSGTININQGVPTGTTRMRIRAINSATNPGFVPCNAYALSETEDYTVSITPFVCTGPTITGAALGPSAICAGDSMTLTFGGSYLGLMLQWQSSPAGANNYSPIPGATSTILRTAQSASTDYRCVVTCTATGTSASSNVVSVVTPAVCYCTPSGGCGSYYISRVIFGSIDNSSTCISNGYSDYSLSISPPSFNAGTAVPITLVLPIPPTFRGAWIDYDHNGHFEPSEFTDLGSTGPSAVVNGQIYIHANALPGITRLRLKRSTAAFTGADACINSGSGETEDYNINILPAPIAFYFTPFKDTLYNHITNLTVRIIQRDIGLNMTDSLKPRVWAKSQGSSSWTSFQGQLISGNNNDGYWNFPVKHDSLGIRVNACDSVQYYFVAQDLNTPFNIGYFPETGIVHTNVLSQMTAPATPFGYRLKPRLRDSIYVDGFQCRYTSLTKENGLFQDILNRKLEGDLTILIEYDLSEDGTYAITNAGLNGHHLYIRPASNTLATLSANFTNGSMIRIENAKNVTIDGSYNGNGRFLRLRNQNSSSYAADSINIIKIANSCDSITIQNLQMDHVSIPGNGFENSILLAQGNNRHISILNNFFTGYSASFLTERHVTSINGNNEAVIRKNEFNNYTQAGIKMYNACSNWIIDSNHFYRTTVPTEYSYDCSAINAKGSGHLITNNYIGGKAPYCANGLMKFINNPAATLMGIEVNGSSGAEPTIIANNRIDNINADVTISAAPAAFYGIYAYDNNCIIKQNTVGNSQQNTGTYSIKILAGSIMGVYAAGVQPVEIRDNVVAGLTNNPGLVGTTPSLVGISRANLSGGSIVYNAPAIISGNTVSNIKNIATTDATGIISTGGSYTLIEKNVIHDLSVTGSSVCGISFSGGYGATPSVIQQNRIYNLVNTSTALGSCCGNEDDAYNGIIFGIAVSNEHTGLDIINNQITLTNNNISSPVSIRAIHEGYGSLSDPSPKQRIIYNSIYIGGTATSYGGSTAYMSLYHPVREMYNNLFYNERTGGTKGHFAYRFTENNAPAVLAHTRNNNNLYIVQDTLFFAQWSAWYPNISWATWRSNTNFDDTSYLVLPANIPSSELFVDKDHGNLNINFNNVVCWNANNKAKPYSLIAADYDSSNIRSTSILVGPTDIGSDEFSTMTIAPERLCPGSSVSFPSNLSGVVYQWQVNTGNGFTNISDDANYTGTNTSSLQLTNVPSSWYDYKYRCITDGNNGEIFSIKFSNTWTGIVNASWENPGNWSCGFLPDGNTDVVINSGTIVINSNTTIRSLTLGPGVVFTVNPGYIVTVTH